MKTSPYAGKKFNLEGITYDREKLSKKANDLIDEIICVQIAGTKAKEMLIKTQGLEDYLSEKIKEEICGNG